MNSHTVSTALGLEAARSSAVYSLVLFHLLLSSHGSAAAVASFLPVSPTLVSQRYLSSSKHVSPRQERKLGHRQAQVGQVIAILLLLFELFSSASSRLLILFIKLYSELWCFSRVCSRLRTYSYEVSIMTATERNVNIFKRREPEGYRKGCRVKHESENIWPLLLGKVSFVLKCCDEPEVVLASGTVFPFAVF